MLFFKNHFKARRIPIHIVLLLLLIGGTACTVQTAVPEEEANAETVVEEAPAVAEVAPTATEAPVEEVAPTEVPAVAAAPTEAPVVVAATEAPVVEAAPASVNWATVTTSVNWATVTNRIEYDLHAIGNPDAALTITEFSDFM